MKFFLLPLVQPVEPNKQLLELIEKQISEKEKELECPVCLDVVGAPIFMCSELHLICMNCSPKVKNVLSVGLPMLANLREIGMLRKQLRNLLGYKTKEIWSCYLSLISCDNALFFHCLCKNVCSLDSSMRTLMWIQF